MPPEADPVEFLLSGGKVQQKAKLTQTIKLGDLFTKYQSALPEQAKEKTTRPLTRSGLGDRSIDRF